MNAAEWKEWGRNLWRLLRGRPPWSAQREFAYYSVEERNVREHRARQEEFAADGYAAGLRIAGALGLWPGPLAAAALARRAGAAEVWALDAVPKQIWAAAERLGDAANVRFLIADAQDLPFADGSFDLVVANLVLHHIAPLSPLLHEALRVLRPGGRLLCFEPSPLVGALVHEKTSANEAPIAPLRVRRALRGAGFLEVRTRYYWSRLQTSWLGPLSPGYRVEGRKPGTASGPVPLKLRRQLQPMELPGLQIDAGCSFAGLAREQEREILAVLGKLPRQ